MFNIALSGTIITLVAQTANNKSNLTGNACEGKDCDFTVHPKIQTSISYNANHTAIFNKLKAQLSL